MQSILLQFHRPTRLAVHARTLRSLGKAVAVTVLLAATLGGSIHVLNLVLHTTFPDPFHRSVVAAVPVATPSASAVKPMPATPAYAMQAAPSDEPNEPEPGPF